MLEHDGPRKGRSPPAWRASSAWMFLHGRLGEDRYVKLFYRRPAGGGQTQCIGPRIQTPALSHPSQKDSDASSEKENTPFSIAQIGSKTAEIINENEAMTCWTLL